MTAPPHLAQRIEKARAKVAERVQFCKDGWSLGGQDHAAVALICWAYHQRCTLLREAEAELRALEAKMAEGGA